ncbi:DUF1090 domain-containing protein [Pseudomonas sp. 30_B]|uniref:DUF1090 domain-containing protein n=1 Tax=Pseudomonas sp. 30_B TaxID=2813575 RepID=UPI001A9CD632|nr:DUF1090 domain-containing protein [Pseudomonas sp. 30_B]
MKKLKSSVLPLVFALTAGFTTHASADCAHKRAALEYQLQKAQQYGNSHRIAGLKRALSETNAHCVDQNSSAQLSKTPEQKVAKLQSKLSDKQQDVREAQADLREAQAKGDPGKIAKAQNKLQEKQAEVTEITKQLRKVQAELTAER